MPTTMEQLITSLIERRVPYNGPVLSDVWNDTNEEIVRDITTIQTLWNTLLYPLLGSMPSGPVEILATDRTGDISPFDNGLDGSQLYMDMTATLTDESYYSETLGRPYTIKESFEVFEAEVNEAIEDAKEAALLAGLTEDAKQKIGARIFYTGQTSAPDSLDGLLQRLDLLVDQIIGDVFNENYDAGAPPDYSAYPLSGGLQSRDNTLMEYINSLLYMHDNSQGEQHIEIHHVFVDDALEGQIGVPQVISNMTKAVENVEDEFSKTTGLWPGIPDHLEDELNQIRTAIRRLAGWSTPTPGDPFEDNTFDASVALWTALPSDSWVGNLDQLSLVGHINRVGTGTPASVNPHGLHIYDIDGYALLLQDADEVPFAATTLGVYLDAGSLATAPTPGAHVQAALELLEIQIDINETDIATNLAAIAVNAADIVTNAADIATNVVDIADHETRIALHETWIGAATDGEAAGQHVGSDIFLGTAWKAGITNFTPGNDVQDALDGIDIVLGTTIGTLTTLLSDFGVHIDGDTILVDGFGTAKHTGEQISFASSSTEPLEYPADPDPPYTGAVEGDPIENVSDALNEFHQLWITDRRVQDARINAAGQEIQRYGTTNIPTLFPHHFEIYVEPTLGSDQPILGDGTSTLPYRTIGRALQDVGKMIIPKAEIILVNVGGGGGADFDECVLLDNLVFELGDLYIHGDDAVNPDRFRINGGSRIDKRIQFFGAGTYDMAVTPGSAYTPTVPGEKTVFYIEITTAGERSYEQGEAVPVGGTSFVLTYVPDDDAAVIFTDTAVFALETPWVGGAPSVPGQYRIDYKGITVAGTVETFDTLAGGTVDYYTTDAAAGGSIDRFRWYKNNEAPPDDYADWDDATAYVSGAPGDLVSHQTGWYECILNHTNEEPPETGTYWAPYAAPTGFAFITEDSGQLLDQGVSIVFLSDVGHNAGDIFFFTAWPNLRHPLTFRGAKGVRVEDCMLNGGVLVDQGSNVGMANVIAVNSLDHAVLVTGGSKLNITTYDMADSPGNGLHARENSYILAQDYDSSLRPAGADVVGWGGYAEWHGGIETCILVPTGGLGTLSADGATFGAVSSTCPTTTTTSSTTSTTTSTSTTSTTASTTSSTTSTTSTSTSSTSSSTSTTTTTP